MVNLPATQTTVPLPAGASPEKLSFGQMLKRAEVFARTELVPKALQGRPEAIVLVGARGAELGVPFATALQEIHVIENRTFASAQLRLALIRRAGHEVRFAESSSERAVIRGRRAELRGDPDGWVTVTWTIDDAARADLLKKDNWKKYPADMLRARAASALSRMEFSDVLLGMDLDLDTAEEAGFDLGHDLDEHVAESHPSDENGGGEEVEDAVVVDDPSPGPKPASTEPTAPGVVEAPERDPETPGKPGPRPRPRKPGERQDVTDLKWRLNCLPADERAAMRRWLAEQKIPDSIDVSEETVTAINAELDRRDPAAGQEATMPIETQ